MISDKELLLLLNDESLDSSSEARLQTLLDEELEKSEEKMDTDLIEYCLNALQQLEAKKQSSANNEKTDKSNGKIKTHRFRKILMLAAIISVLIAVTGAISASAFIPNIKSFNEFIQFWGDHILISFTDSNDKADDYKLLGSELAKELSNNGFDPVLLPEVLLSDAYRIYDIEYQTGDAVSSVTIRFEYNKKKLKLFIDKYAYEYMMGESDYLHVTGEIHQVDVSGISAYVFYQIDGGTIAYKDGLYEYNIFTPFDIEKTIEIAKTIK